MAGSYVETVRRSFHNCIPSGRQLPRTPPSTALKEDFKERQEAGTRGRGNSGQNRAPDFIRLGTEAALSDFHVCSDEPNSMLKGMKGYQLTAGDLDFIKKMKEEQLVKKLQGDLKEVQKSLRKEMMALELACASRERARAELNKFPSREELAEWLKVVLQMTSQPAELKDVDVKSLLAAVTMENIQSAEDEKRLEVAQMKKMVEKRWKKEAKKRGLLEKQFASEQLKIQELMRQLSDLKLELAQEEACEQTSRAAAKKQTKSVKAARVKPKQVEEQLLKLQESVRVRGTRGPAGASRTTASQPKPQNEPKAGEGRPTSQQVPAVGAGDAGEEAGTGLRRSKRIASRR